MNRQNTFIFKNCYYIKYKDDVEVNLNNNAIFTSSRNEYIVHENPTGFSNIEKYRKINICILNFKRNKLLTKFDNQEIEILNSDYCIKHNKYFKLLFNLNFNDRIKSVKDSEMLMRKYYNDNDVLNYVIFDKFKSIYTHVPLLGLGLVNMPGSMLEKIKIEDVNKDFIWKNILWKFLNPMLYTCRNK